MAVRAWIEAQYRARRSADGPGLHLLGKVREVRSGQIITLGGALGVLQDLRRTATGEVRAALNMPSGRWLLDRETAMLNERAGDSGSVTAWRALRGSRAAAPSCRRSVRRQP